MQQLSASYEFDPVQNTTIRSLAGAMRFVAIIELIVGLLYGVAAVFAALRSSFAHTLVYAITACLTMILATMLSSAASSFRAVVDTRGADVLHLMRALDQLGGYFRLKRALYIIAIVVVALGIALVVVFATGHARAA
ncbi:MAG TPA: hypothetical protein VFQ53_22705 [Kofleriaceae bacterium]|nr:hypothetical protein [Kofleriaceae bacterium]